ncbi:MAG: hypothetical protein RLZZ471_397 [Actinomycetota bacterium]
MVIPVVVMILGITLGTLSIQLERMKLVSVAASISRGLGRGEPLEKLQFLLDGRVLAFKNTAELICAEVSAGFKLPGLPGFDFPISDTECARRLGL